MIHQITTLLWALLCSSLTNSGVQTHHIAPQFSTSVTRSTVSDSLIFKDLKTAFEDYHRWYPQEKIYLHLDRNFLKPGETIWFNAFLLNAGNLLPSLQSQMLKVDLLDVRGSLIQTKDYLALGGVANGEFDFSPHLPGGIYKIRAYSNWMLNFEDCFEREITLQKVVLPRLNMKLEFERKGLSSGDVAIARFDAYSLDNRALAGRDVSFSVSVGGKEIGNGEAKTDANGRAYIRFQLPDKLETSDGLLNVQVEHNGQMEAISRPVPIVLNNIDLQFFPEGGDAVAGLSCRMAFKALNEFGKPADVEGVILDSKGRQVAAFSSFHNGMGAFDFVPEGGEHYEAQISKPVSVEKTFALPEVFSEGSILQLLHRDAESLTLRVSSNNDEKLFLTGYSRDKMFFSKALEAGNGGLVKVPLKELPIGIARFTLFDSNKNALAERLVFVNREQGLSIRIKPDKEKYLPREKVKLNIHVADHKGKAVKGHFSLAVTDESLLSYADDKQGHLLASLLLEQDVKGKIEEPNFYFDATEPKSQQALDFLLMTQGWRRFAWEDIVKDYRVLCPFAPEKAVVSGTLLGRDNRPVSKSRVELYPNGPVTKTDKNGYFSFENINMDKFTHVKFHKDQYYTLNGYGSYAFHNKDNTFQQNLPVQHIQNSKGGTYLTGNVKDSQEPLIGASVKAVQNGNFVRGAITDLDGNFRLSLNPGEYNLEISYTGYRNLISDNIQVPSGKTTQCSPFNMATSTVLQRVSIIHYKVPFMDQDKTSGAQTLTSEQIQNLPTRSLEAIVATTPGTTSIDGGEINIKGSRSNGTNYYIDGIRLSGAVPPVQDIEQLGVITGGLGAEYGDFTSGSIKVSGRNRKKAPYPYRPVAHFSQSRVFYAPTYNGIQNVTERSDFRPTIFWVPNVETDQLGEANVEFYTSDAITNFRATLEGLSDQGQPGRGEQKFFAQKPVDMVVKTPASVISGDVLNLQVAVSNHTNYPAGGNLMFSVPAHFVPLNDAKSINVSVPAGETKVISFPYKIGLRNNDDQNLSIKLSADEIVLDAFETSIRTLDAGYPVYQVEAGYATRSSFQVKLLQPAKGTLSATLSAYPSPLEDLLKGMERMLRQPSGCFEQVSSSNYPNLLVLDLIRQNGQSKPEVESRAMSLLEDGYKKLIAYECTSGGFDWWGRDPGHEGLTAYGVLEFTDMAKVFDVDKKLIDRTVKWLLSRRNQKGGWTLNPNSTHGWQNDPVLDSYIVWALAEAGYGQELALEIKYAEEQAVKSGDPYQLALLANALLAAGDSKGKQLLQQLLEKQEVNGSWLGSSHSVMYAYGDCFRIETTALAALALMKSGKKTAQLQKAMDFLVRSKTEYGYGSTQSTVMALKAIIEFVKLDDVEAKYGQFTVSVDGKPAGQYTYSTKSDSRVEVKNLERFFTNDNPKIEVFFGDEKAIIPFDLEIKYASKLPRNSADCPLSLTTVLEKPTTRVGETVRLATTLKNNTAQMQASPMVVLGIPSGLTLQPWQLKKLKDEKKCDFYELWDGFAVFHFEKLLPGESRDLNLDLRADITGTFEAPASQAFLYYSNDQRVWSKPETLEIK